MWIKSGNKFGQGRKIREEAWAVIVRERLSPRSLRLANIGRRCYEKCLTGA